MTTAVRAGVVTDLLDEALARDPGRSVHDAMGGWTYAELDAASRACAAWLRRSGVAPGDRVVGRVGNVREFLALMFGTLRLGATFVPINPAMRPFRSARRAGRRRPGAGGDHRRDGGDGGRVDGA